MRWELLFADLEAQLEAARTAATRVDVAELTRAERSRVRLADRLRGSLGCELRVLVADQSVHPQGMVDGRLVDAAVEWFLLASGTGVQLLIPTPAVRAVRGLATRVAPEAGLVERRLGLGHVLRALARDRVGVQVLTDAGVLTGRIDVVGADHLELTEGAASWVVPFGAVRFVRSS
ncbi:MAG: hypothetical protein KJ792_13585 [Actinobacteria bacterium]|nr:hypothetical protein [Actinomycetota bacterium]MCG2803233.1 hypothetical protein [Cellulomonas sp.]